VPLSATAALLLFPVRPAAASARLRDSKAASLAPLVPGLAAGAYLASRGCAAADAAAGGAALVVVVAGLAAGGTAGCYPARRIVGLPFDVATFLGPCLAFAAWTPILFVAALAAARTVGAGPVAALASGLTLLVWGVVAGIGVLGGESIRDYGRGLVASCLALAVSLMGLWLGLVVVAARLVMAVPAPVDADGFRAGDLLLVRVEADVAAGELALLVAEGREALLARADGAGGFDPVGAAASRIRDMRGLQTRGRVFFRSGGPWGGNAVSAQRKS